jgi:hypothetical protein
VNEPASYYDDTTFSTGRVDIDHRLDKGLRGYLRQVMADTAGDQPVRVLARVFLGIGCGVRMRCAICITFKGDTAGEVLAGQDGGVSTISRVKGERRVLARGISISHSPKRSQVNPVAVRT